MPMFMSIVIVRFVLCFRAVVMLVSVMRVVIAAQKPGAEQIYSQAKDGDGNRLVELDRYGRHESHERS